MDTNNEQTIRSGDKHNKERSTLGREFEPCEQSNKDHIAAKQTTESYNPCSVPQSIVKPLKWTRYLALTMFIMSKVTPILFIVFYQPPSEGATWKVICTRAVCLLTLQFSVGRSISLMMISVVTCSGLHDNE